MPREAPVISFTEKPLSQKLQNMEIALFMAGEHSARPLADEQLTTNRFFKRVRIASGAHFVTIILLRNIGVPVLRWVTHGSLDVLSYMGEGRAQRRMKRPTDPRKMLPSIWCQCRSMARLCHQERFLTRRNNGERGRLTGEI